MFEWLRKPLPHHSQGSSSPFFIYTQWFSVDYECISWIIPTGRYFVRLIYSVFVDFTHTLVTLLFDSPNIAHFSCAIDSLGSFRRHAWVHRSEQIIGHSSPLVATHARLFYRWRQTVSRLMPVYTIAQNMAGIDVEAMRKLLRDELQTSTKGVKDEIKTRNAKLDNIQTVLTQVTNTANQTHDIATEAICTVRAVVNWVSDLEAVLSTIRIEQKHLQDKTLYLESYSGRVNLMINVLRPLLYTR